MTKQQSEFAKLLGQHMKDAGNVGPARLSRLINELCGLDIHRSTIRNWQETNIKSVRDWRQLAAVARVLRLNEKQATQLLQSAGLPSALKLWLDADEQDRELLSLWAEDIHKQLQPAPSLTTKASMEGPFLAPNLPPRKLVGRDQLLKDLKQGLLAGGSLALSALEGMAGIGKTAVAIALAHDPEIRTHFQDRVLWANLGQAGDAFVELGRWARALGIPSDEVAKLLTLEARAKAVREKIGTRRMLLVVDDAWEPETALAFKVGGPDCAHLVTTRLIKVAVTFAESRVTTVKELNEADSLTLLTQLAPDVVQAEPEFVLELIRAVGGLPLSLVLMGNYLRIESSSGQPRRIKAALQKLQQAEDRLKMSQPQIPSESHPSLPPGASISPQAIIAVTEAVLDEPSRSTFYALSVFPPKPNSFSEEAALAVADKPVTTLDRLTDYSLLEGYSPGRYTLHQAIADYAGLQCTTTDPYKRMGTYFVGYAETHLRDYDVLEIEATNMFAMLDAAIKIETDGILIRGLNAFTPFMETRGLYQRAVKYLTNAEKAARTLSDTPRLIKVLSDLGTAHGKQGDATKAEKYFQDGLALAKDSDDHEHIIALTINLGSLEGNRGNLNQAKIYFREALASARKIQNQHRTCDLLQNLATVAVYQGEFDEVDRLLNEGLALARKIEYLERLDMLLAIGVSVEDKRGNKEKAGEYLLESLGVAKKLGYQEHIATIYSNLGALAINQKDYTLAKKYLQEGLPIAEKIGHRETICRIRRNLGELATKLEDYEQAENYLDEALNISKDIGHGFLFYSTLILQGKLFLLQKRLQPASMAFSQAQEKAKKENDRETTARALRGLGQIAAAQGDIAKACQLGEESLELFKTIGHEEAIEVAEWLNGFPVIDQNDGNHNGDIDDIE